MEMVAAARLRRAEQEAVQSRPYADKMRHILEQISAAAATLDHPFFEQREIRHKTLVLFTGDRGLCGSYNTNLIRKATQLLKAETQVPVDLVLVGKKGDDFFKRRNWPINCVFKGLQGKMNLDIVHTLTEHVIDSFISGQTDQVQLIYARFITKATHRITVADFLPVTPPGSDRETGTGGKQYIFEPDALKIFDSLMPAYARTMMQSATADALASEHAARMMAMGQATRNADEMVDALTLQYNKARQSVITKELLEIVSGAEALSG
jgi:F-type H+-transporting ATPase subunit gamma